MQQFPNKRLAFSYVRMSTEKQIKGDSLRRQVDWSTSYAARNNLDLQQHSFRDIGVSAWKGKNRTEGALGDFIKRVKEGTIPSDSFLLVENLDRLSRMSPLDALDLFRDILKTGITIVTLGEDDDEDESETEQVYTHESLRSNSEQLMSTITTMLRANKESEVKSKRIRKAFKAKHELSRSGVRTNQKAPGWIKATRIGKGQYEYAPNERADDVRWIFEQSAAGMGFAKISRMLNERNVPPLGVSKRGWWGETVAKIVTSRTAIGEYQPQEEVNGRYVPKGDPIADYYPPVVSTDLWLRAQKPHNPRQKGGRAGTVFSNLFGDLATCAHCGSRMYMISKRQKGFGTYQYLVCASNFRKHKNPECTLGSFKFRYAQAEKFILDNIREFGISDHIQRQRASDEVVALDEEIASLTLRLQTLDKAIARITDTFESEDEAELPDLVQRLKERRAERNDTQAARGRLEQARAVQVGKATHMTPASAIAELRAAFENPETPESERYSLRVRCHNALLDFIDFISFDAEEKSYTVVMFGGLRAYKFHNVEFTRNASQRPQMIDMTPQILDQPHYYPAKDAKRIIENPVSSKRSHWRVNTDMVILPKKSGT